jgi:curli production assembly/transport component CsgF
MRNSILFSFLILITTFYINYTNAAELIYVPINPSFGGNALNAQWLANQAAAQNEFKEKEEETFFDMDPMERFEESLTRQILSRLSYRIIEKAFGESELESGHYEIGDYIIDVDTGGENIKVIINNPETGGSTIIEVPYYNK